jgi:hypothetical protein
MSEEFNFIKTFSNFFKFFKLNPFDLLYILIVVQR